MNKRKIVQIAVHSDGENHDETLYALTDDGRVFILVRPSDICGTEAWVLLPNVPQADLPE